MSGIEVTGLFERRDESGEVYEIKGQLNRKVGLLVRRKKGPIEPGQPTWAVYFIPGPDQNKGRDDVKATSSPATGGASIGYPERPSQRAPRKSKREREMDKIIGNILNAG